MSATSRRVVSGAYPATPATTARAAAAAPPTPDPTPSRYAKPPPSRSPLPEAPRNTAPRPPGSEPLIPTTILDAPTQRFYAVAVYAGLFAYRLYDWARLVEDDTESVWLFLKWVSLDLVYIFCLPELRIPWLELSQNATIVLFFLHAILDFMLMFNIGIPFASYLLGFVKVFYDREVSVSEQYVKVSNILHNSSLIMGKQVINILPEGTAVLNPGGEAFCLGDGHNTVSLPIHFNATVPIEVELVRADLDTNEEESMKLSRSQLRELQKLAKRQSSEQDQSVFRYDFAVQKPGVYRLEKVLDEYKLEVQRRTQNTFVVPCPRARVAAPPSSERCLGDLSDLSLEVEGTPPLKIVYSRTINGKDHSFHFQSLQPEGFSSPLLGSLRTSALILPNDEDISWARAQKVTVGLNESMNSGGEWQYSVDEVHDAFGNVAKYLSPSDDPELRPKPKHLAQNFLVKERPRVSMEGCDLRNPLKVAKGRVTQLPIDFAIAGQRQDTSHTIAWTFSPIDTLTQSGDHGDVVITESYHAKSARDLPSISSPGLYTLKSVSSGACEGEVQEPASCLLLNPLEPSVSLQAEEIPDTCAGNSVGLRVDFDFVGTPPFTVDYERISNGVSDKQSFTARSMRHHMDLTPITAGTHKYIFHLISDSIYPPQPLTGPDMVLETIVKPQAAARIIHPTGRLNACLEEEIDVDVALIGEAPFTLEWELVHDGRRKSHKVTDIEDDTYKIKVPAFAQGGEYSVAVTAVKDKSGCRNFLHDELKISVRRQRPRAAFGLLDGKLKKMTVEGSEARLPVRLTGESPWTVSYRNLDGPDAVPVQRQLGSGNSFLDVTGRGTFEIVDVSDNQCHGVVDPRASKFEVDWFPRPELNLVQTENIARQGAKFVKQEVCEGDIDGFEISLNGSPPYHVEYEVRHKSGSGSGSSISRKQFDAALGKASIQMDTTKAGTYSYEFSSLTDNLYDEDKRFTPVVLEQRVNARPSAAFVKPGQTFKMCMSEQDNEETIPVTFKGQAPFYLEIEIKHQSGSIPETYRIASIDSSSYGIQIPRQYLKLGSQQVRIRKVRDSRGCQQTMETGGPTVQVQLYDAPAIYPLETRTDYCVGERIAYTLSGTPPFEVWYMFEGTQRRARSATTTFRRIAELPGAFEITNIADKASECRAAVRLAKAIHPMPSVRISRGRAVEVDIHEGGEVEILFEFTGTPPFEFTYTRSTNARRGQRSTVLETRHDVSHEYSKVIRASEGGTYEVVSIKDHFCAFSRLGGDGKDGGQKALQY